MSGDELPDPGMYVPEPPRNLKADEREWTVVIPAAVPEGQHVEIELPGHHGMRDPKVTVVKDSEPKAEEAKDGRC